MPIAINGSGTLTGLSVGGLEDGIITPAELSTGAPSWDSSSNLTNVASINAGPLAGFRNAIINGNFDHWQRGTSFTGNEYGADRWVHARIGTTHTASRQPFTLGQTAVPDEPAYFCRTIVSSVAGAGNLSRLDQRIEDVRTFAGQQITASFWAKADAAKPIAVDFVQYFGSGGSPSADVTGIGTTKVTLSTSWQKITMTATVPSVSGKTLGSDGNSHLRLNVWFDAGSSFNSRTDTLGQQSGTFDIAQVQIEAGPVVTPFERRPIGAELSLCQRYYQSFVAYFLVYTAGNGTGYAQTITFPEMRIAPSVTPSGTTFLNSSGVSVANIGRTKLQFGAACNNAGAVSVSVNATLTLSSEL